MNSSAQLRSDPVDFALDFAPAADATAALPPFELQQQALQQPALKQQVAQRLAAHRARRAGADAVPEPAPTEASPRSPRPRSARIAAAVAERYAQSPSYRAFLSSEAERSVQQAHAAAEIATINAHAIAIAQQQLLADLDQWQWTSATEPDTSASAAMAAAHVVTMMHTAPAAASPAQTHAPVQELATPAFTVRLYEDVGPCAPALAPARRVGGTAAIDLADTDVEAERDALDDEIAFRKDPWFDEVTAPEPLPANLIEFPRQLIAARKARPRRAEGPLLDDETGAESTSQLRIFEVEADQISATRASDSVTPDWTSITLAALPSIAPEPNVWGDGSPTLVPQAAPVSRRLMSGLVDATIIAAATILFLATAAETHFLLTSGVVNGIPHAATLRLSLPFAGAAVAGSGAAITLLYLLLSFRFGDQTAGMRYARIGLCTFADENPTRRAMRRRLLAMFLSAVPLGLGFVWACLDEDRLGWHDRMSRMYQRAY